MKESKVMSQFTYIQAEKILNLMKFEDNSAGSVIFKGKEAYNELAFVLMGDLKYEDNLTVLGHERNLFGVKNLMEKQSYSFTKDIICENSCTVSRITFEEIYNLFDMDLEELFVKNQSSHEVKIQSC